MAFWSSVATLRSSIKTSRIRASTVLGLTGAYFLDQSTTPEVESTSNESSMAGGVGGRLAEKQRWCWFLRRRAMMRTGLGGAAASPRGQATTRSRKANSSNHLPPHDPRPPARARQSLVTCSPCSARRTRPHTRRRCTTRCPSSKLAHSSPRPARKPAAHENTPASVRSPTCAVLRRRNRNSKPRRTHMDTRNNPSRKASRALCTRPSAAS